MTKSISIRDLQKMSAKTLDALDEPTPITAGDRTLGAVFPLKKTPASQRFGKTRALAAETETERA